MTAHYRQAFDDHQAKVLAEATVQIEADLVCSSRWRFGLGWEETRPPTRITIQPGIRPQMPVR